LQGRQLSLTVRRGSGGAASDIRFQGIGSTALLLVPDVPICGVSMTPVQSRVCMCVCVAASGKIGLINE
jgi:hypothetical protein